MAILNQGETLKCPHCGKHDDDPVEDYVVPGSPDPTRTECNWCYKKFTVQRISGVATFEVLAR